MNSIAKFFPYVLILIFTALTCWGTLGLVEYFFPTVKLSLQNQKFPPGLQFIHFATILGTGVLFLVGYCIRWPHTPFALITMFAVLASLCFVETVDFQAFGGGTRRFFVMGMKYVMYLGLSTYFLRSAWAHKHFALH